MRNALSDGAHTKDINVYDDMVRGGEGEILQYQYTL